LAYGNLVSYEETPIPGAYQFVDRTGNKTMLTGGPAEDLKKRLDASASLQPQLAANGAGGKPAARLDAGGGLSGSARVAAMNQAAGQAANSLEGVAAPPTAAASTQPAPAQGGGGGGGADGYTSLGGGFFQRADGVVGRFKGPTAATKGGLQLRGETRQGVQELDPEFLAQQDDLQIDKRLALQAGQDAAIEKAEHDRAFREEMEKQAINNQAQAEARDREITAKVGDLQKKYDAAEKDVASARVDPRGGSNIFDVIAIGLGTAGAVIGKHENFALNIVQRKIDRHIAAQEHAINIKRETKNDLSRMLEANQGNRELARLALQSAYTKKAQATFEARAAGTGSKELKAQHAMTAATMQEQYAIQRKAWEDAARGNVTQHLVNVADRAGSAGGFVPETDQVGAQRGLVALEKDKQELAQGAQPKDGKAAGAVPTERTTKLGLNSQTIEQGEQVLSILGDEKGDYIDPEGALLGLPKEKRQKLAEATQELAVSNQIGSGMGATKDDAALALNMSGKGKSVDERKRAAERSIQQAAARSAVEIEALPPEQQQQALDSLSPKSRVHVLKAMKR
jgi:hypothetical protein